MIISKSKSGEVTISSPAGEIKGDSVLIRHIAHLLMCESALWRPRSQHIGDLKPGGKVEFKHPLDEVKTL